MLLLMNRNMRKALCTGFEGSREFRLADSLAPVAQSSFVRDEGGVFWTAIMPGNFDPTRKGSTSENEAFANKLPLRWALKDLTPEEYMLQGVLLATYLALRLEGSDHRYVIEFSQPLDCAGRPEADAFVRVMFSFENSPWDDRLEDSLNRFAHERIARWCRFD